MLPVLGGLFDASLLSRARTSALLYSKMAPCMPSADAPDNRVLLPLCVIVLQSALTSLCYCFTECSYLSVIAFNSKLLTLPASMLCSCRPYSEIHPNGLRAKGQFREFRDQIVQRSFQIVQISVQIVQKSFLIDYVPKVSSDTWNSRPKRAWRAL